MAPSLERLSWGWFGRWPPVVVLAFGLGLAACSTPHPSRQAKATAETCSVFSRHAGTKQIEMAAADGQISNDAELARDATQLQKDLAQPYLEIPAFLAINNMVERCRQLGFPIAKGG